MAKQIDMNVNYTNSYPSKLRLRVEKDENGKVKIYESYEAQSRSE